MINNASSTASGLHAATVLYPKRASAIVTPQTPVMPKHAKYLPVSMPLEPFAELPNSKGVFVR